MLVIERAALNGGEKAALGFITPAQLRTAAANLGGRNYKRGNNEYTQLAIAGEALLKAMPQSGTQPRLMTSAIGSAIGAAIFGAPGAVSGQAIGPAVGQAIQARLTGRPAVQAYLGNQLAAPIANLPQGSRIGAAPGAIASGLESQPPLRGFNIPMDPEDRNRALAQQLMRR